MGERWWQKAGAWGVSELGKPFHVLKVEGDVGAWAKALNGEMRYVRASDLDLLVPIDGPPQARVEPRRGWGRVEVVDGGLVIFGRLEEAAIAGAGVLRVHALDEAGTRVFILTMATPMVIELLTEEETRRAAVPDRNPCGRFAPSSILVGHCMHCGASEEEDRRAAVEHKIKSSYTVLGDDAELAFEWESDAPGARLASITSWEREIAYERWAALAAAGLPLVERAAPTAAWEQGRWRKSDGTLESTPYEVRLREDGFYDARPVAGDLRSMWVPNASEIAESWLPSFTSPSYLGSWIIGTWKTRPLDGFWEVRDRQDGLCDLRPFGGELEERYRGVEAAYVRAEFVRAEDQEEARKQALAGQQVLVIDPSKGPSTVTLVPMGARWVADVAPDATDEGGS